MRTLFIALLTLAAFSGCAKKADTGYTGTFADTTTTKPMSSTPVTYLALGDSYTVGQSEPQNQSFPYQLTSTLNSAAFNMSKPDVIAATGWTTDDLIGGIASSDLIGKQYSFVTLLIGVNDQYQHLSQDNYRVKFKQVLQTAITFAGGDSTRVFVLSIPDYGVTPFAQGQDAAIGPQIDEFNAINKQISLAAGVNYIDITAISREAAYNSGLIAPDGLHPSGIMYTLWLQQLEPLVAARLSKK